MNKHIYITSLFIWAVFMSLFVACDDEKFSSDPAYHLSFSTDTVSFDTVFTTIGSSTYKLIVRNPNDKSLNIRSVHLANAGNSGFMVNVDGHHGTSFSDLEIRRNDSMFVFIEVHVDPTNQDNPILMKDSLVFQLESGVGQDVKLMAYGQDIIPIRGLVIDKDTAFTSYRPILVYDSLKVNEGVKLVLEKGTRLYFHDKINFWIYGSLHAEGTLDEPIIMRGDRLDKMTELDLPYDRLAGQWGGVQLFGSSYDNYLNYVDIHGGMFGIRCDSSDIEKLKLTLVNSVVHNAKGNLIDAVSSKIIVGNSQITNAGANCIALNGGDAVFTHCTIANFYSWDVRKGVAVHIGNEEGKPLVRADFQNCLITGSMSDELSGGRADDESIPFEYSFLYSLVNTKLNENSQGYQEELSHYPNSIWDDKKDDKDKPLSKGKNFLYIGTEDFDYDFRPDSLSAAVNLGSPEYAVKYPLDRNGRERISDGGPDVGCYEWMPGDKRREE